MRPTGEKDFYSIINKNMKNPFITAIALLVLMSLAGSCKNSVSKQPAESQPAAENLILIGKEIITDIIVKPDTLGDPWEVEKVQGYDGNQMYSSLFTDIYNGKLQVYDVIDDRMLKPEEVKEIEKEFNADHSKIAKLQFLEDWYYDPLKNQIIKKIKSVSFGYETRRSEGLPAGYSPLFRVKSE
jgi:hypothetical protein